MREKSTCRKLAYLLSKSINEWQLYWRAFYKLYVEFTGLFSMFFQLKPTLGCFLFIFRSEIHIPRPLRIFVPLGRNARKMRNPKCTHFCLCFCPLCIYLTLSIAIFSFSFFFLYLSQNFSLFSHSSSHIFPPEWHRLIFIFPKGGVFSIMYTPELAFTAHVRKICMCITLWLIQINTGKGSWNETSVGALYKVRLFKRDVCK